MLYSSLIRPKRHVCLFSMNELVHYFLYCGLVIVYLGSLFSSDFSSYLELNNSKHPRLSISGSKDWIYIYICNCRQYRFGLLGLISAVLMLGWR